MLDKGILVTLITGFTAVIVTVWITVDFCLYRRKKAAIRAAKADTFYRKPRGERCVEPYQQKKTKDKKGPQTKKTLNKKSSVRKLVNFFTGKKGANNADDKDSVIEKESDPIESAANGKRSIPGSKLEAGGSGKQSQGNPDNNENKANGVSKKISCIEEEVVINDDKNRSSPRGSVLGKIQSAPSITGKWINAVGPSEIPTGKKALPPLKGKTPSKQSLEGKPSFSEERMKEQSNSGDDIKPSNTNIELNEIKEDKLKSKPPFKQKTSKTKMKIENNNCFMAGEPSEPKGNSNEVGKKPPLMKRLSRNRVDSLNDGSTSSTDTKETFMEDRTSSTSSSWTCDESSRKRTGSLSDSTTSSGSIELEKRRFRIKPKPLKRNQSNMSVSDTTPLT